ncbi:MAG: MoxR family ATPase, partial [Chloroflexi bacterium]|nr:MoxR family ATPase [Chloroflexota bacterium]
TVEGITHFIPRPFLVMATQNPIEYEGTFPLPEAQLDRFLLMITLGYPSTEEELAIVAGQEMAHPIDSLQAVTNDKEIIELQEAVKGIYVDDLIKRYIVTITETTRDHPDVSLGSSPRGSLGQFRAAQAMALIRGRDFVLPDDVKELAVPTLSHRIIVSAAARMRGIHGREIIAALVGQIPVPGAEARGWFRS